VLGAGAAGGLLGASVAGVMLLDIEVGSIFQTLVPDRLRALPAAAE
jgi:hypothetical protein